MSRTEIALPQDALMVVGWDRPLATFFAQVFKAGTTSECRDDLCYIQQHTHRDCRDDLIDVWVGCDPRELPTLSDLERALGKHFEAISPELKAELEQARQIDA